MVNPSPAAKDRVEVNIISPRIHLVILSLRPSWPGIRLGTEIRCLEIGRQDNRRPDVINRERPVVSGDVPVEFIMILKKTELPISPVGDDVTVLARIKVDVLAPHVDADAPRPGLGVKGLGNPITQDPQHFEIDPVMIAEPIGIISRKIPVDPPFNLIPLGPHRDRFAHLH